ncbi:MAG TPA: hypothetical protein PLB78_17340, partial [Anaerolineae bacterium]|nr:hypothetical protein [Anaerolineae bacterium]
MTAEQARPGPVLIGLDGARQVEFLASELAAARFDVLYTGPEHGTRRASSALAARLGLRPVVHSGLQQLSGGPAVLTGLVRTARFAQEVRL